MELNQWSRVTTSNSKVTRLHLHENNLSGTIPSELGELGKIERLTFFDNQLSGTIPSELGNLTSAHWIALDRNQLTGTIPSELQDLSSLQRLYLFKNQLSGSIPTELGGMTQLQRLFIQDNTMLNGGTALVEEMETLATTEGNLVGLGLWSNDDLTGAAKQASNNLGKRIDWAALWAIYVLNNGNSWKNKNGWFSTSPSLFQFSDWYGIETNSDGRVNRLNLSHNNLSEDITSAFEALKGLERLDLSYNTGLAGELSKRLMDLNSFTELNIRCTGIIVPTDTGFQTWLQTITFIETQTDDGCTILPAVPVRMVTLTPGVQRLSVSWEESADADGYKVQWKSGAQQFNETDRQSTVTGGGITGYTITGLTAGTEYTVRVIATKSNAITS